MAQTVTKDQMDDMFGLIINSPIGLYVGDYENNGNVKKRGYANVYFVQNSHGYMSRIGDTWYGEYRVHRGQEYYDVSMWYCHSRKDINSYYYYLLLFELYPNDKYRLVDIKVYFDNDFNGDYECEDRYVIVNDYLTPPVLHHDTPNNLILKWIDDQRANGNIIIVGSNRLLKQDKRRSELRVYYKNNHSHTGRLTVYGNNTTKDYTFIYNHDGQGVDTTGSNYGPINDISVQIYRKLNIDIYYFTEQDLWKITFVLLEVRYELTLYPSRNIKQIYMFLSPAVSTSTRNSNKNNTSLSDIITFDNAGHITSNARLSLDDILSLW